MRWEVCGRLERLLTFQFLFHVASWCYGEGLQELVELDETILKQSIVLCDRSIITKVHFATTTTRGHWISSLLSYLTGNRQYQSPLRRLCLARDMRRGAWCKIPLHPVVRSNVPGDDASGEIYCYFVTFLSRACRTALTTLAQKLSSVRKKEPPNNITANILFGPDSTVTTDTIFDLITLLAKQYLYRCKSEERVPLVSVFRKQLKRRRMSEEYGSTRPFYLNSVPVALDGLIINLSW